MAIRERHAVRLGKERLKNKSKYSNTVEGSQLGYILKLKVTGGGIKEGGETP